MGGEQILGRGGIPRFHGIIGSEGVFHLLDFARRAKHAFPGDDGGDLLQREGVVLYGERGMDGADAVFPAQDRNLARNSQCLQAPE